jgi:hypothetical protein
VVPGVRSTDYELSDQPWRHDNYDSLLVGSGRYRGHYYGEIFFSNCEAVLNNNVTVNGGTGDTINMTNADGQVISEGIVITPTVIQCLYSGPRP